MRRRAIINCSVGYQNNRLFSLFNILILDKYIPLLFWCFLCVLVQIVGVRAEQFEPPPVSAAPVNPDFIAFQMEIATFGFAAYDEQGHALGHIPSPFDRSHLLSQVESGQRPLSELPSSYDLRSSGHVTDVRNQGGCGSCWAFASYGPLESWLLKNEAETRDFSENHLKNYHGFDWGPCEGGNADISTAYLARWSGPVDESDDPYHDWDDRPSPGGPAQKYINSTLWFFTDNDIKNALMSYGAMYVSMYYEPAFYDPCEYTYYYAGSEGADHAVTLIGWDDNKTVSGAPGDGAWLAKNSWGTDWADNGFFWISYYDAKAVQYAVAYCDALPTSSYATNYQYDPLGWTNSAGFSSSTAWAANVFTATADEDLKAVALYAVDDNVSYEIYIYDDFDGSAFSSLLGSTSGVLANSGYHTISLPSVIELTDGDDFSIVVEFTTTGYIYPIPIEMDFAGYSPGATAGPGQSYVSSTGGSFTDITTYVGYENTNVCIKALTVTPAPSPPEITSTPVTVGTVGKLYSYDVDAYGYPPPTYTLTTYPSGMTIDPNTGLIEWTPGASGYFDVEVTAGNGQEPDANQGFTITVSEPLPIVVYDFGDGTGNHLAWGYETDRWSQDVDGKRRYCRNNNCSEVEDIESGAHVALANSDDSRYTNPNSGLGDESTLYVEFNIDEDPNDVKQIDALWEGCANSSKHAELYIWDYVQGNWGNGAGNYGENNFMDDGSGSSDFVLGGSVTNNVSRYISADGQITLLIYVDSTYSESYNDYVSVTVHIQVGGIAPVITSTPVTEATVGQLYSYDVNATGIPEPNYALITSPAGMDINSTTGLIEWMPDANQLGLNAVEVRASNGQPPDANQSFNIDVNGVAAMITSTAVTVATVGQLYSYDVNATGIPEPNYALITSPAGMDINWATGLIIWMPTESQSGLNAVVVEAANASGTDTQSFDVDVLVGDNFDDNRRSAMWRLFVEDYSNTRVVEDANRLEIRAAGGINDLIAFYVANGWCFDVNEDFAVEIDFHFSSISDHNGWVGIFVENDDTYVSISAGSDSNESYFYYETVVDTNVVFEKEPRDSNDGTLYIWYEADSNELYLSHLGYTDVNAYNWQTIPSPLLYQWASPVYVDIGGGSEGAVLSSGKAYLDNFRITEAALLGWPPATDLDGDGFVGWGDIGVMNEYWLGDPNTDPNVKGDLNSDDIVNFLDFAEFGPAW